MHEFGDLHSQTTPMQSPSYLHMYHGELLETLTDRLRQQDEREAALERDLTALLIQNKELKEDLHGGIVEESREWKMTHEGMCDYTREVGGCRDPLEIEYVTDTVLSEAEFGDGETFESPKDTDKESRDGLGDSISEVLEGLQPVAHGYPHNIYSGCSHALEADTCQDSTPQSPYKVNFGYKDVDQASATGLYTDDDEENEGTIMRWIPKAVLPNPPSPRSSDIRFCQETQQRSLPGPVDRVKKEPGHWMGWVDEAALVEGEWESFSGCEEDQEDSDMLEKPHEGGDGHGWEEPQAGMQCEDGDGDGDEVEGGSEEKEDEEDLGEDEEDKPGGVSLEFLDDLGERSAWAWGWNGEQ